MHGRCIMTFTSLFHTHVVSFVFPVYVVVELGIPCHGLARLGIIRLAFAFFSWQILDFLAMVWHGLALLGLL